MLFDCLSIEEIEFYKLDGIEKLLVEKLKVFEQVRGNIGHIPASMKFLPYEDMKVSREFILSRRILDSCM